MNKNKITARKELYDHLKYLVGHEEANKMIDEYKEEILNETNFYELRSKIAEQIKEEFIKNINELIPHSYRKIIIYENGYARPESREQVDKVDVINIIDKAVDSIDKRNYIW